MTRSCDVAIVGGGIGGLTLATSLLTHSIDVQVFERDAEFREIGAGVAIAGNATRLLARLGIDLTPGAHVPPEVEFRRWKDGALLGSHPIGERYLQQVGAPLLTLHRGTVRRLLAAAVPADRVHMNHLLVGLSEEGAGVRLRFQEGEDVLARVVAAVDGIRSTVRGYVCGNVGPVRSGEIGFRGVIPISRVRDLPNPAALAIWCGPRTHVVHYGMDGGKLVNLLAVYQPDHLPGWTSSADRLPASRAEALAVFEAYSWDPRVLDLVRNIEGDMNFWALSDLPALSTWSRGRVVILGDAAHAPLPHQGQGAALAIEDAYALGALLGKLGLRDYGLVFEQFERLRRRRTTLVQGYSRVAGRALKRDGEAARRRDARWPSLPERIRWIHEYREEELVP